MSISVVVVGAGPTGLAVSNLLGQMGISVLVLERNPASLTIPRAIVLDDEGARTLQAAGVVDEMLQLVLEGDGPLFFDEHGEVLARVGTGSREYGFNKRFFMHQPELERVLKDGLRKKPSVELRFGAEVCAVRNHAEHVEVHVKFDGVDYHIKAQAVLACDGARSFVRQSLGIEMQGNTYGEDWLVIDTENDPDDSKSSKAHCRLDRPYLSIPAPRGGRRYEFKLLPGETRQAVANLEAVQSLMQPIRKLRPEDITRMAVYTFEARIAERLTERRVLLLGDAAHLTPPFAGQGLNAGLRDASNVAWKVAMVARGDAGAALFSSYDFERRDHIRAMIQLAVTMGEFIMPQTEKDKELRSALLAKLDDYPSVREYILGMKFKPRPRYDAGVFVGLESLNVPASLVGSMIPQPRLEVGDKQVRLDDLIGPRFALIVQSPGTEMFAVQQLKNLWPELDPVLISTAKQTHAHQTCRLRGELLDPEIAMPLRAHRDQLLLVRPDRYAAAAFWPEEMPAVVAAFREALKTPIRPEAAAHPAYFF